MLEPIFSPALIAAAVILVLGLAVAIVVKRFQITDSVGFVALIILPLAVYGVASGHIKGLTAPGGWEAEFREIATSQVTPVAFDGSPLADRPLDAVVDDLEFIAKGGVNEIDERRQQLVPGRPIAITLTLGRQGYYSEQAIATYIRSFLTFDADLTVVFLEENERFVASANGNSVLAALEVRGFDRKFVEAVERADLLALRSQIVLTSNKLDDTSTNSQALQIMQLDGVDALIKVDATGRAVGLVRRDQIMSQLMISLASG